MYDDDEMNFDDFMYFAKHRALSNKYIKNFVYTYHEIMAEVELEAEAEAWQDALATMNKITNAVILSGYLLYEPTREDNYLYIDTDLFDNYKKLVYALAKYEKEYPVKQRTLPSMKPSSYKVYARKITDKLDMDPSFADMIGTSELARKKIIQTKKNLPYLEKKVEEAIFEIDSKYADWLQKYIDEELENWGDFDITKNPKLEFIKYTFEQ